MFDLNMMNPINLSGIPAVIAAQLKTYNYDPAWLSEFSLPAQDAAGYSILTPTAGSKIMYVSASGNDGTASTYTTSTLPGGTWDNPTGVNTYATVQAAYAEMRDGYNDYILVKSGDTVEWATQLTHDKAGPSTTARQVYGVYGGDARPVIRFTGQIDAPFRLWASSSNVAVMGWEFTDPYRDPDDVLFDGLSLAHDTICIYAYAGGNYDGGGNHSGYLIENCKTRYVNRFFDVGSAYTNAYSDVIVRRNVVRDTYKSSSGGHPMGIFITDGRFLVEENDFIHCGWLEHGTYTESNTDATIFSHSVYASGMQRSIFRNNFSYLPSSMHIKCTSNNDLPRVAVALTGAAETAIVMDSPIPPKLPQTGTLDIETNGASTNTVTYTSWTNQTFTINSADFSGDNASVGNDVNATENFAYAYDVYEYGNVNIDGELSVSLGGNSDLSDTAERWDNCRSQGNVISELGNSEPTGRGLAWGIGIQDQKDGVCTENLFLPITNAAVTNTYAVNVLGYEENLSIYNNISTGDNGQTIDSDYALNNVDSLATSEFVNYGADALSYLTSIGETSSYSSLADLMFAQRKGAYDTRITSDALQTYFRQQYALVNDFYVVAQPVGSTVSAGDEITASFNVVGNTRLTYQWYDDSDDSAISGQTSNVFSKTSVINDNGLNVYCIATDDNSLTETSSTIAFVVNASAVNKLANSEAFNLWSDTNLNVTTDAANDSTGSTTAEELELTGGGGQHAVEQSVATTGNPETMSFEAKYVDHAYIGMRMSAGGGGYGNIAFNIQTGAFVSDGGVTGISNGTVTDLGDGWYRCSFTVANRDATLIRISLQNSSGGHSFSDDGKSLYLARAMLEDGSSLSSYTASA